MSRFVLSDQFRTFDNHLRYVKSIVENDGPDAHQYVEHLAWYARLNAQIESRQFTESQRDRLRDEFGPAYSASTLQGYVYRWPLGYAGDFQLIEKIYDIAISADSKFEKYDLFFQNQQAPRAVRNRKQYFKQLVFQLCERHQRPINVLNLASGPCREIRELFDEQPSLPVSFVCLDIDDLAVAYAKTVLDQHMDKVTFVTENIFRFKPKEQYTLIWSAGLFDYFDDRTFWRILKRFIPAMQEGGELVVGNFGEENSTKGYMEAMAKWYLHHRSDAQLVELARHAGASDQHRVLVGYEPTRLNRFLHVTRSTKTIRVDMPHDLSGPVRESLQTVVPLEEP